MKFFKWVAATLPGFSIQSQQIAVAISFNFLRDFVWAIATQETWNIYGTSTDDIGEQWLGQQVWGTAAMLGGFALFYMTLKCKDRCSAQKAISLTLENSVNEEMDEDQEDENESIQPLLTQLKPSLSSRYTISSLIFVVGAAAAITPWNSAQLNGYRWGKSLGFADDKAKLFASLLTGIAEGPVQYLIILILSLLSNSALRKELLTRKMLPKLRLQALFSITIGAIPGAVWNLVYELSVQQHYSSMTTGCLVATGVGCSNLVTSKLYLPIETCYLTRPSTSKLFNLKYNQTNKSRRESEYKVLNITMENEGITEIHPPPPTLEKSFSFSALT